MANSKEQKNTFMQKGNVAMAPQKRIISPTASFRRRDASTCSSKKCRKELLAVKIASEI